MRARNIRSYHRPTRIEEALYLTARGATPLAGGTRLLAATLEIPNVVDLCALDLAGVEADDSDVALGAMATLQDALDSPEVHHASAGLLPAACRAQVSSRMIRGMATLGGESVQADGDSEVVAALLALNAVYTIVRPDGTTAEVPALRFLRDPRADLSGGALVRSILIPGGPQGGALARVGADSRRAPLLAAAVTVTLAGETCSRARIAFTGLTTSPARVVEAEARLEGSRATETDLERCVTEAQARAAFRDDERASASYRCAAARPLLLRALKEALGRARARATSVPWRARRTPPGRPSTELPYFTSGRVEVVVNGEPCLGEVEARSTLLDLLRAETLWSVRRGCETGDCGACTVLVEGRPICACLTLAARVEGRSVHTVEGVGAWSQALGRARAGFRETGATGCGYCTPSRELCAAALVEAVPQPTDEEVKDALAGCRCPCTTIARSSEAVRHAGRPDGRVDEAATGPGHPSFVDDIELPRLLHARVLRAPSGGPPGSVDAQTARAMPGVACVLVAGEGGGLPASDDRSRIAVVAAEDPDLARRACDAVEIEPGPPPGEPTATASAPGPFEILVEVGNVEGGLAQAERTFESTTRVVEDAPAAIEPPVALTWLDENGRLNVRSSCPSPLALRRLLASRLALSENRIRVLPLPSAAFHDGALLEDLAGALTLRTGRPVRIADESRASRVSHTIAVRSGVRGGRLTAIEIEVETEEGDASALRSCGAAGLDLYHAPHGRLRARSRSAAEVGSPRDRDRAALLFALETHVDQVAASLGEDPLAFRLRHWSDEPTPTSRAFSRALGLGAETFDWASPTDPGGAGPLRRGRGVALAVAPPCPGMARATVRMDDDGSFHVIAGPAGLGTEATLANVVSQALGVPAGRVVVHVPDTDLAPRDGEGAHAVTSALAAEKAASLLEMEMRGAAGRLLSLEPKTLVRVAGAFRAPDGRIVSDPDLAQALLRDANPGAREGGAAHAEDEPPSLAAVFAEVEVDTETGSVRVLRLLAAVDAGRILDPPVAHARLERGMARQAGADDVGAVFAPSEDPSRPLGALQNVGAAAAVVNAVAQATGVRLGSWPLDAARVWEGLDPARAGRLRP